MIIDMLTDEQCKDFLVKNCKTKEGTDNLISALKEDKESREILGVDESKFTLEYFSDMFGSEKDIPLPLKAYLGGKCLAAGENDG